MLYLLLIGLQQYGPRFVEQAVNGETLLTLTDKDLFDDLQVKILGHRRTILSSIDITRVDDGNIYL